jgi:hypothetical protein
MQRNKNQQNPHKRFINTHSAQSSINRNSLLIQNVKTTPYLDKSEDMMVSAADFSAFNIESDALILSSSGSSR